MGLFKAIILTLLGALATGGVVFFAMNPEAREEVIEKVSATEVAPKTLASSDEAKPDEAEPSESQSVIDRMVKKGEAEEPVTDAPRTEPKTSTDTGPRFGNAPKADTKSRPEPNMLMEASTQRVLEQAERISDPQLRQQAYLNVVDYALKQGDFDGANALTGKFDTVDYKFTALSRIAMRYAQLGYDEKAFELIDTIDDPEFADILRMQVIETLAAPEKTKP